MVASENREEKRLALAHRLQELTASPLWREVVIPYLEEERAVQIENMASLTDPMQLMRYAGAVQTLHSLIHLEKRAREVVEQIAEKKLGKFKN